jgi:hypothetical protein
VGPVCQELLQVGALRVTGALNRFPGSRAGRSYGQGLRLTDAPLWAGAKDSQGPVDDVGQFARPADRSSLSVPSITVRT